MEGGCWVFEEFECEWVAEYVEEEEEAFFLHCEWVCDVDGFEEIEEVLDGGVLWVWVGGLFFYDFGDDLVVEEEDVEVGEIEVSDWLFGHDLN